MFIAWTDGNPSWVLLRSQINLRYALMILSFKYAFVFLVHHCNLFMSSYVNDDDKQGTCIDSSSLETYISTLANISSLSSGIFRIVLKNKNKNKFKLKCNSTAYRTMKKIELLTYFACSRIFATLSYLMTNYLQLDFHTLSKAQFKKKKRKKNSILSAMCIRLRDLVCTVNDSVNWQVCVEWNIFNHQF